MNAGSQNGRLTNREKSHASYKVFWQKYGTKEGNASIILLLCPFFAFCSL